MRGITNWNYNPFCPLNELEFLKRPHIVRLAPFEDGFDLEWLDRADNDVHMLYVGEREGNSLHKYELKSNKYSVSGLKKNAEYKIYIESKSGKKSKPRLLHTGYIPGTVINYLHPEDNAYVFSGRYLCSPSLVRMPDGKLIVSMDVFNRQMPQNHTILFESLDNGKTWQYLTEINPCFWGKLFLHKGELYLLGVSAQYGDVIIGKSTDGGKTWSRPVILFYGSCLVGEGYHRAPCVIEHHKGRLWTSMEFGSAYINGYNNCVISADENGDLLDASNWNVTEIYRHEPGSLAIEGNVVVTPDGELVNFLRYPGEEAIVLKVDAENPDAPNTYMKKVNFPMAATKFEIKRHPNGKYYALGNDTCYGRSKLSVYSSEDLENWTYETAVVDYSSGDHGKVGFQYPVFEFEDDGFLVISRTAFNHAACYHDNNYITCHRIKFQF